ncbi:MAG: hypothetical protein K6G22_06320 [Lachnospiraceae bacterium]|nr:hypothetical protein [Lachnospiraceae bacterium]
MPTPEKEWPMDPLGRKLHEQKIKKNKPVILGPPPDILKEKELKEIIKNNGSFVRKKTDDTEE